MNGRPTIGVLGAGGFVGRWVAREAALHGVVRAGSRRPDRTRALLARWRVPADVQELDVSTPGSFATWLKWADADIVVNAIGYGVDPGERDPDEAHAINVALPPFLAQAVSREAGRRGRPAIIVHLGTAAEYGAEVGDLREDGPATPTTLYGQTKRAGTEALLEAAGRLGVPACTARLFTVFGAGEHAPRLLPSLVRVARETAPIPLTAGLQRRDFGFVGDVAAAVLALAFAQAAGRIVNVATGVLTPVRDFVEQAARVLGVSPERLAFGAVPTRGDEMTHEPVNVARLRELTGQSLPTDLAGAIARALRDQTEFADR